MESRVCFFFTLVCILSSLLVVDGLDSLDRGDFSTSRIRYINILYILCSFALVGTLLAFTSYKFEAQNILSLKLPHWGYATE